MAAVGLAVWLALAMAAGSPGDPAFIDITVAGIELESSASGKAFVMRHGGSGHEPEDDFPQFEYTNKGQTELLELLLHPGGTRYAFAEYRVHPLAGSAPGRSTRASVEEFVTGKGIRLGMSVSELLERLGEPQERKTHGKATRLTYRCESWDMCPVLKQVNMPEYEARYLFVEGVLTAFEGGYPYP